MQVGKTATLERAIRWTGRFLGREPLQESPLQQGGLTHERDVGEWDTGRRGAGD